MHIKRIDRKEHSDQSDVTAIEWNRTITGLYTADLKQNRMMRKCHTHTC